MTEGIDALAESAVPDGDTTAGMLLRSAREAAGLSLDAVAQQLKLAPRQVKALEESDFANLPGRTFIRGFVRNYARLLRLDSAAVLAALPDSAPALQAEHASLAATPRAMGELPADAATRPSWPRWAIPLAMVTAVAITAVYEFTRPTIEAPKPAPVEKFTAQPAPVNAAPAPGASPLPNPLAPPAEKSGALPGPATVTESGSASAAAPDTPIGPIAPMEAVVAFAFLGTSWVEVRDAGGVLVLSATGYAGGSQWAVGHPPLEVVLGNARAVTVTWQGKTFDFAPYVKQNVAKFTLK